MGTRMSPNGGPAELEAGGVGLLGADRDAGRLGAGGELGQQLAVEVERGDVVAVAGEVERHAPGAGADVEHRARLGLRQLAPQRQVGRVAAALDVVPDDRAHRQYSLAAPRSESRPRSSSSAV